METAAHRLHAPLIGRQGGRADLNTPALVLDLDAFTRNLETMAAFAAARGLALRPHAKTHKCAQIARRQIAAGAVGVCCAKLGEAEALADAGIEGLLITSPVPPGPGVRRLAALARRSPGLMAVVDHLAAVAALGAALVEAEAELTLLVDIDPGFHRTGVADADAAVALAQAIVAAPGLTYGGVQFYCGVQQHIGPYADRRAAIASRTEVLKAILARLSEAGLAPALVTGGGTGSHQIDAELGVLTEIQAGSYIFMDRQYADCELVEAEATPFAQSLMVEARVVSANHAGAATVDAGLKAFSTEDGPPPILDGAPQGSTYRFMGDEHGLIQAPPAAAAPALGAVVRFAPPHCDPTVNLYDAYHVVRGDTLVDIWPIEGRGRSA
ncbi:MAG: DSD1 family PLP-dependent enzyme [Alphaproteobacteria bacterium]|nr:DSD1 family PLP-dependent enzyme [Alphaproteobacteria bacterium]